jgi:uncharacterized protein YdbL (DUF1318 family)
MKKVLTLFFCLLTCSLMSAQSMKMVVDKKGEVVGRLVKVNADTYTISVQDDYDVPKAGLHVETFSAAKGQGIVYRDQVRVGNINVRKGPSTKSAIIAKIADSRGMIPDDYPCLGLVNGWYKIRINGKIGYVRKDLMCWDGMCTF